MDKNADRVAYVGKLTGLSDGDLDAFLEWQSDQIRDEDVETAVKRWRHASRSDENESGRASWRVRPPGTPGRDRGYAERRKASASE